MSVQKLTRKDGRIDLRRAPPTNGIKPGEVRNPKGITGSPRKLRGRRAALAVLDRLLDEDDSKLSLDQAFRGAMRADALGFYERFVMPLLPRGVELSTEAEAGLTLVIQAAKPPMKKKVKKKG